MTFTDSDKRAARTAYHALVTAVVTVPVVYTVHAGTPAAVATVLGALPVVAKVINTLEDRGLIPAWLKGDDTPTSVDTSVPVAPTTTGDTTAPTGRQDTP